MRSLARLAAALAVGLATAATAAPPPPAPKLIVAISIDQFSADLFERYRPTFTSGLKRLAGGIAFANGYQSHAATETCPGHSTILTGRHPAGTGIVANNWLDRATGRSVYCVSVPGADETARGPQNLRAGTLGDWLKAQEPGARVVSVSGKDRAAIMLGGHKADAIYWWVDGEGFGTSSYAAAPSARAAAVAARFDPPLLARLGTPALPYWPALTARCRGLAVPQRFGDIERSGTVPPDVPVAGTSPKEIGDRLRASPLIDAQTLAFAGRLADAYRLGRGPRTDLLAVSLSATDYVGHLHGSGGAEMCVQMGALDRVLGAFLARLDARRIRYVVALTADHGGPDAVERLVAHGVAARRMERKPFVDGVNAAVRKAVGLGYDPVRADDPQELLLLLKPEDVRLRDRVQAAAIAWLRTQPIVEDVLTRDQIVAAPAPGRLPPDRLSVAQRIRESYDPGRSGDLFVVFKPWVSPLVPRKPGDAVSTHGSPWDYDRRVPILFWWKGIRPASPATPIETVDIAPTLAAIGGITAPAVDGQCLKAVARCP